MFLKTLQVIDNRCGAAPHHSHVTVMIDHTGMIQIQQNDGACVSTYIIEHGKLTLMSLGFHSDRGFSVWQMIITLSRCLNDLYHRLNEIPRLKLFLYICNL
jgi:hypothetical protein